MRSPFNEVITSPAFSPAFSAGVSWPTARTRMPSPSGAPKNNAQLSAQIFPVNSQPRVPGVHHVAVEFDGRASQAVPPSQVGQAFPLLLAFQEGETQMCRAWPHHVVPRHFRFAQCRIHSLRVAVSPYRQLNLRPAGISWIMRRNCSALSTRCPFSSVTTSFSFNPAFDAGLLARCDQ